MGNFFPTTIPLSRAENRKFSYGGATRSRTGLNGFAIKGARQAHPSTPGEDPRADGLDGPKSAAAGNFFPVLGAQP